MQMLRSFCLVSFVAIHELYRSTEGLLPGLERALQQIEVQTSFSLSRTLGTPNITSKGVLEQRSISVPAALFPHDHNRSSRITPTKRLVEEVPGNIPGVDGSIDLHQPFKGLSELHEIPIECPSWTWRKDGQDIFIVVQVPRLVRPCLPYFYSGQAQYLPTFQTHATITSATLDIEPRRLTMVVPGLYALDINLNLSDSALGRAPIPPGTSPHEAERALTLKRARDLDVDGARAEWRTKERCLVIVV
jgi:hypothetical protein